MLNAKIRHSAVRRKAGKPTITLAATSRRLDLADLLQDGPLPSNYIKEWLGSPESVEDLLPLMDSAHWIGMPDEAKVYNVLSRPFVYELLPLGKTALLDANRLRLRDDTGDPFKHRFIRSLARFSFQIAPRSIPGLRLITQADILASARCPEATRQERFPSHVPLGTTTIKPDAEIFGYEYTAKNGSKAFMFFHGFEADRGTEQSSDAVHRKTLTGMFRNYARYFDERLFKTRYGLSQVSVPIITTKPGRMHNMMEFMRTELSSEIQPRFLFKTIPDFRDPFPPPTAHMVTEPWLRVGAPPLHILETLKVTAEGKSHDTRREDQPSRRTGPPKA